MSQRHNRIQAKNAKRRNDRRDGGGEHKYRERGHKYAGVHRGQVERFSFQCPRDRHASDLPSAMPRQTGITSCRRRQHQVAEICACHDKHEQCQATCKQSNSPEFCAVSRSAKAISTRVGLQEFVRRELHRPNARELPDRPAQGFRRSDGGNARLQPAVQLRGQERHVVLLTSSFGALALGLAGSVCLACCRTPSRGAHRSSGCAWRSAPRNRCVPPGCGAGRALLVLCGILLGLPIVFLGANLAATLIFGISPHDWATVVAATVVLGGVGTLCSLHPAVRASRIDPMVALRQE